MSVKRQKSHQDSPVPELASSNIVPEKPAAPAQIFVVGGDPVFRKTLLERLGDARHVATELDSLEEARTAIRRRRPDLIILDPALPDGDGLELAETIQKRPGTGLIVFSNTGSFASAIKALRSGAVDFVRLPVGLDEFMLRVTSALARTERDRMREQRLERLHRVCSELDTARKEITTEVDALCTELVASYQDLSDQIEQVAMASEFRTLIGQELDVEDALRTMLEYLLTKTGPTNAAVFLPDMDGHFSLSAYVNYDCARESIDGFLDQLGDVVCPQLVSEDELMCFDDTQEFSDWLGVDTELIGDSQVLAGACRDDNECLAIIILFRKRTRPFPTEFAETLDILRRIFAEQLGQIIHVHHRAAPAWPADSDDIFGEDDDHGFGFGGGGGGIAA